MTADDESSIPPDHAAAERHRLVPAETIRAQCMARYGSDAVAVYLLAVRDEVERCRGIGAVDTWSRFARLLQRHPAYSKRGHDRIRKELSRHFTVESKGPPWKTTMLVVHYLVPQQRRAEAEARFAVLYQYARGEPAPTGVPASHHSADANRPRTSRDDPAPDQQAIIDQLRARNEALEEELALARAELRHRSGQAAGSARFNDGRYRIRPRTSNVPRQQQLQANPGNQRREHAKPRPSPTPLPDAEGLLSRLPHQPSPGRAPVAPWTAPGNGRTGW